MTDIKDTYGSTVGRISGNEIKDIYGNSISRISGGEMSLRRASPAISGT
jgi:hypothetical protein